MLENKDLVNGFMNIPCLVGGTRERKQFLNGKATDVIEAVRLTALTENMGTLNIDLCPFTSEKLERCKKHFGEKFTVADLIGVQTCKIYAYEKDVRVNIIAADIQFPGNPWEDVKL